MKKSRHSETEMVNAASHWFTGHRWNNVNKYLTLTFEACRTSKENTKNTMAWFRKMIIKSPNKDNYHLLKDIIKEVDSYETSEALDSSINADRYLDDTLDDTTSSF